MKTRNTTAYSIVTATASDADRIIALLGLAFSNDPIMRWMYPDTDRYWQFWPDFARLFGGRAFEHGTAFYVEGHVGPPCGFRLAFTPMMMLWWR